VQLDLDAGLFGSCEAPDAVAVGEFEVVGCDIVLPPSLAANTEPSFTVVLTGDGFERRDDVTMLVAEERRLEISLDSSTPATTDADGTVTWTLINSGNTAFDERVEFDVAKGWEVAIDGPSTVSLEPGASRVLRVTYTSTNGGEVPLTLQVNNVRLDGDTSLTLVAPRQASDEGQGSGALSVAVGGLVLLLIVAGVLVLRRVGSSAEVLPLVPKVPLQALPALATPPVAAAPVAPIVAPSAAPTGSVTTAACWACRGTITGPMLGCPSCGARFHLPGTPGCTLPDACPKCGTARAEFLSA
jgi:hypothetical protein